MERYNYREAVLEDVLEYIRDNYTPEEIRESLNDLENRDEWETDLYDSICAHSLTSELADSFRLIMCGQSHRGVWNIY